MLGKVGFEPLGEFAPRQQDAPTTAFTFQPDIRAKTCDSPLVRTARMLLSQAEMIVETKVG
jgi:hypothetical protein